MATVGAAGIEVAQEALAEAQDALLPLVPHLDTLRWMFVAAALAGIAVTIYARWDDWKAGRAVIAALAVGLLARPWARTTLRWGAVALAILLFLLSLRRAGERAGRMAGRLKAMEKTDAIHRRMLDSAARRLRDGRF